VLNDRKFEHDLFRRISTSVTPVFKNKPYANIDLNLSLNNHNIPRQALQQPLKKKGGTRATHLSLKHLDHAAVQLGPRCDLLSGCQNDTLRHGNGLEKWEGRAPEICR
jgi:hypothetical protein